MRDIDPVSDRVSFYFPGWLCQGKEPLCGAASIIRMPIQIFSGFLLHLHDINVMAY
jgi:hypothetical protein